MGMDVQFQSGREHSSPPVDASLALLGLTGKSTDGTARLPGSAIPVRRIEKAECVHGQICIRGWLCVLVSATSAGSASVCKAGRWKQNVV